MLKIGYIRICISFFVEVIQGVAQGPEKYVHRRNPQDEIVKNEKKGKKNQNLKLQNRTVQNPRIEWRTRLMKLKRKLTDLETCVTEIIVGK